MTSTTSKWLSWEPPQKNIAVPSPEPTKPTKPTKPGFVSFGTPLLASSRIIHGACSQDSQVRTEAAVRFGQPHARLFPYIGHVVQTPRGRGKLLQVFTDRATVDLGRKLIIKGVAKGVVDFFHPSELEPLP